MKETTLEDYWQEGLRMCYVGGFLRISIKVCARWISPPQKKILEEKVLNNQVDKIRLWFQPENMALQGWNMAL